MKKYTYPNGYLTKIEYWSSMLIEASRLGDVKGIEKAQESLNHFVGRHLTHHGAPGYRPGGRTDKMNEK